MKLKYIKNDGSYKINSSYIEIGQETLKLNEVSSRTLHCVNNHNFNYLININIFLIFRQWRDLRT